MQDYNYKYEKLENFKSGLDNKLEIYNKKMGSLIEIPNKNSQIKLNKSSKKIVLINSKFIIVFIGIGLIVYYTLEWLSPEYIKKKELNTDTYFNEYVICTYKHVGYTLVYSISITALLILGVYIYNTTQKS